MEGRGKSSDLDAVLDQVELTESGASIKSFTVTYKSNREADLSGLLLNGMDPGTGDIHAGSKGVQIGEGVRPAGEEKASIGRSTEIVDADGKGGGRHLCQR